MKKTWTEQRVYICCPLSPSLPHKYHSWTWFLLGDHASGSHWPYTLSIAPWTNGTAPYLRIQFIISYLFPKSAPPDRFCHTSCSLWPTLLPTHSSPPYPDFSACLTVGEFLLHPTSSIIPSALTPSHFSSCHHQCFWWEAFMIKQTETPHRKCFCWSSIVTKPGWTAAAERCNPVA